MADAKIKDLKWLLDKLGDSKVKSINFEHDDDWYVYEYDALIVDINDAINGQTKKLRLLGGVIAHYFQKFLSLKEIEALSVDPDLTGKQAKLCYKQAGEVWKDKENKERKLALKINDNLYKISRRFKHIHDACTNTVDEPYAKLILIQDIINQRSCCFIGTLLTQQDNPPQLMNEIEQALAPVIEGAKTEQRTALEELLKISLGSIS